MTGAAGGGNQFRRVGIIGLGLIGGSIAARLKVRAPQTAVLGVDAPEVLDRAIARGAVDERRLRVGDLSDADLIILATPVDAAIDLIESGALDSHPALITDTGSTKRQVVSAARRLARFIGGHPMAGGEHGGIEHADAALFDDRPWLFVSEAPDGADATALARFATMLGAVPAFVDAAWHDRTMAYVSHVPQLLAVALMRTAGASCGDEGLAASGRAFREMTRLASSPPELWRGILRTNADNVAEALRSLVDRLSDERPLTDGALLESAFAEASAWRRRLDAPVAPPRTSR